MGRKENNSNGSQVTYGNFDLVSDLKANNLVDVRKYKSRKTGLTVVIAQVEGPVVNGYFTLATEAFDDDGLPHTLEHLIFLGSEDYPYKGVLDLVANRMLASGSNAWTDTDHTCYTVTTAGSEGFLSLMPVYLDHILYPTLTDSGFLTEVHHINGEGRDAGVVYCEMQGKENTGEARAHLELLRCVYPGKCGYKSETGGKMKNLRESTTNVKVQQYHKEFYRPDNLTLIITGQVDDQDVFKVLEPLENKILSKGPLGHFSKPWQSPVPELEKSYDLLVPYPCDLEDNGLVYIGWRGPSAVTELYEMSACSILLKYLTYTSISPLQRDFVEINDPYASSVCLSLQENSASLLFVQFENVPTEKLDLVKDRLFVTLKNIENGTESFNMKRMKTVIQRHKLETLTNLEDQPHDSIAFMIIGDLLYGRTEDDLRQRLNPVTDLERMAGEPEEFWRGLLKKYLLDSPSVTVRGKPSREEQERMSQEEDDRIEKQKERLGAGGLKQKEKDLIEAIEKNEVPPPEEMLTKLPIPDTSKIHFHSIKSFTTEGKSQHEKFDLQEAPVYMHLDHVKTNFVYLIVLMDTKDMTPNLRPYLLLFMESLLESPVQRGETLIPYEEVVAELEGDTIATSTRIGLETTNRFICGPYCQSTSLILQVEAEKYQKGIKWLKELLFDTKFLKDRLKVIANKMINDVAQCKRKGNKIAHDLIKGLNYNKDNNHYYTNMLRQHKFLSALLEKLDSEEDLKTILHSMEEIRTILTSPNNMVIHMAANLDVLADKIGDISTPWGEFLPKTVKPVKSKLAVTPDHVFMQARNEKDKSGCVVGMGCIESSFMCQTVSSISDFSDPDLPALLVFLQYLTQLEGPMWRQIRGLGLSYSYNMLPRPNEGLLYLIFYMSTNVFASYKEAKTIVDNHLKEDMKFDGPLLDSARSSMIFEIIDREKCIARLVSESVLSYFINVDHDYNKKLVSLVSKVTSDDLSRVGAKYVAPLFDPKQCRMSIVCHPSKADEIAAGFKELNFDVDVHKTLEDTFLNTC